MNEIQTVTKNVRLQQWTAIIKDCRSSGKKVDDYCSEHNISRNAYYYWLRKVKSAAIIQSCSIFAEINPSFTETMQDCSGTSPVSISLGDVVLHVKEGASGHLLHTMVEVLRDA